MTTRRFDTFLSRRAAVAGFGVTGLGMALATGSSPAMAQEATPAAMTTHPIVGTWSSDFDPANPGTMYVYSSFHADGTSVRVHPFAGTGVGVWRATGERTGEAIDKYQNIAAQVGEFIPGTVTVWESFTVDESGDSFTLEAIVELRASDGTVVARFPFRGEPVHRLAVEPPPPLGTPEATPAT